MPDLPAIFLAVGDGSSVLEVVVWLVVGAVWLVSQVAANRKKREQAQRRNAARAEGSDPRLGSPSALRLFFSFTVGDHLTHQPEGAYNQPDGYLQEGGAVADGKKDNRQEHH